MNYTDVPDYHPSRDPKLEAVFGFLQRVNGDDEPKFCDDVTVLTTGNPSKGDLLFITHVGRIFLYGVGGYARIDGIIGGFFGRDAFTVVQMLKHGQYITPEEAVAFEDWWHAECKKIEAERALADLYATATRYGYKLVKVK